VIIRAYTEGTKARRYGHALVVGVKRYPKRLTKSMDDKKKERRSRIVPFVKHVNFNHIMPTRYTLDVEDKLTKTVTEEALGKEGGKKAIVKDIRSVLETRYKALSNASSDNLKASTNAQYFFRKLHF
jgi:large subunit ribosomal protein L27e